MKRLKGKRLRRRIRLLKRRFRRHNYSVAVVLVIIIAAIVARSWWLQHHRAPTLTSPAGVVTYSTDKPSEAAVPASYKSAATGAQPSYIRLPTINSGGFIQPVGVDQHNQIAVPTNIHLAGWFVNTVTPGNLGLSIIDGHIDGPKYPGIFEYLAKIKVGDTLEVDLANGTKQTYVVRSVHAYSLAEAASAVFSQTPGIERELNLVTCGGTFETSIGQYNQRIVVVSEFVATK